MYKEYEQIKLTLKNETESVTLQILIDNERNVYFLHPLTNQFCESVEQCFYGWSEQDDTINDLWCNLKKFIYSELELIIDFLFDGEEVIIDTVTKKQ